MWKLMNYLFGWEYVHVKIGYCYGIRQVKTNLSGQKYVTLQGDVIYLNDLAPWQKVYYLT